MEPYIPLTKWVISRWLRSDEHKYRVHSNQKKLFPTCFHFVSSAWTIFEGYCRIVASCLVTNVSSDVATKWDLCQNNWVELILAWRRKNERNWWEISLNELDINFASHLHYNHLKSVLHSIHIILIILF